MVRGVGWEPNHLDSMPSAKVMGLSEAAGTPWFSGMGVGGWWDKAVGELGTHTPGFHTQFLAGSRFAGES